MGQLGSRYEKKPRIVPEAIQDDFYNRVLLNASTLHCPICIEVFADAPLLLSCGHSFCEPCLRRLPTSSQVEVGRQNSRNTFQFGRYVECPLCRRKTYQKAPGGEEFVAKNYILETILDDIRSISADRESFVIFDETLKFENKRLNATLKKKDEQIEQLRKSLATKSSYVLLFQIIAVFLGAIILKNWFFTKDYPAS